MEQPGPYPAYWSYTMWPVLDAEKRPTGIIVQVTETTLFHQQAKAMNEALLISSVRQHEYTEAAETLNKQLRAEIVERKRVEEALGESEARYRTLFEAMDEGFCIIEKVETSPGEPIDFRYIAANPAFAVQSGVGEVVGKTIREAFPGEPQEWFDTYDAIVRTGNPIRFERGLATQGRVLELFAFRLGAAEQRRVAAIFGDITRRKRAEEHSILLINELNHRVKNMLATVQAIAAQTLRGSKNDPNMRNAFEARLIALSHAHSILTQENWESVGIHDIIARVLEPHAGLERLRFQGPPIRLSPKRALALAMAVHELATNAVKYGALSNGTGQVAVTWSLDGPEPGTLRLQWKESGGPAVKAPSRKGFGSRLIERSLAHDLNGLAKIEYRAEGVVCTITSVLE